MEFLASRTRRFEVDDEYLCVNGDDERCHALYEKSSTTNLAASGPDRIRRIKALQNTGLDGFRQYPFVDTRYTHGYCLGFLAARFATRRSWGA